MLLEAGWRPAPQDAFPDLPQSPRTNGSTGSSAPPAVPQRAAGYVAPHLRGSGVSRPMRQCQLMLRSPVCTCGFGNHTHPLQLWLMLSTSMTILAALALVETVAAGTGASSSGNFSLAHDSESSRGRLGLDLHHQRLVPGAAPPESKTSSKNAKRRGRAKVCASGLSAVFTGDHALSNKCHPCVPSARILVAPKEGASA